MSIVTFDRAGSSAEFVEAARGLGLDVDVIPERGRFDRSVLPALRTIINRRRPDVVVTHQVKSHFLVRLSGLHRKYPWVAFNHGYTTTDRKMRVYNWLDRFSLPKADRVVTVCEDFARALAASKIVPRERLSVLHNSVRAEPPATDEQVNTLRKQLDIKDDERVILAVGRLSKEKAHADLLEAFTELYRAHPELKPRLIIVGDGPERVQLEQAAAKLGIPERVLFAGHVGDVQPFYAMADLLANSSHSEGSPYVLLEAMAAGVPIVATAVGGVPEMLTHNESALLVPSRAPQAMADAVACVVKDSGLATRLAKNAKHIVSDRFSPEMYVRMLIKIYSDRSTRSTL